MPYESGALFGLHLLRAKSISSHEISESSCSFSIIARGGIGVGRGGKVSIRKDSQDSRLIQS